QFVGCPEPAQAAPPAAGLAAAPVSFATALLIVTLPLVLGLVGFTAQLLQGPRLSARPGADAAPVAAALPAWLTEPPLARDDLPPITAWLNHPPLTWLQFLGKPVTALLVPTALAFWLLGRRRGLRGAALAKVAEDGLRAIVTIVFLFGAAGGLKEVIQATGAG